MDEKSVVSSYIKFDMDTPRGRDALLRAAKADQCYMAFQDIDNYFRQLERHKLQSDDSTIEFNAPDCDPVKVTPDNIDTVYRLIYGLRRQVANIIAENGIDVDEEGLE